jgi:hypothetical protein
MIHESKDVTIYLAEFIPLIVFYLLVSYSDEMIMFSHTTFGSFIVVGLILFYASIHYIYGILVCLFVIFYYQTDTVEGMMGYSEWSDLAPNPNCSKTSKCGEKLINLMQKEKEKEDNKVLHDISIDLSNEFEDVESAEYEYVDIFDWFVSSA